MITRGMLNNIKRLNVSKDAELTKERLAAAWDDLNDEQKAQIEQYDISKATIVRSKTNGNISVKVAAALALVSGVNPYYLTGDSNLNEFADEPIIRQFLIDNGYERILSSADSTESRKPRKVKVKDEWPEAEEEPVFVEEVIISEPEVEEIIRREVMTIQEFADLQMGNLSEAEKKAIYDMPSDDFASFMKTLELQSKYTDKAKNLIGLIRLILIR